MINSTGKNLNVLILSNTVRSWETFSCWFSIVKNLPESEIAIFCKRLQIFQVFRWLKRLEIPHSYHKEFSKDFDIDRQKSIEYTLKHFKNPNNALLTIEPELMMIDELPNNILNKSIKSKNNKVWLSSSVLDKNFKEDDICLDAKNEKKGCFISWEKGVYTWIHKIGCPFSVSSNFKMENMTLNEMEITKLWQGMAKLYTAVC